MKVALRTMDCLKSVQGWPVVEHLLNNDMLVAQCTQNDDTGLSDYVNTLLYNLMFIEPCIILIVE